MLDSAWGILRGGNRRHEADRVREGLLIADLADLRKMGPVLAEGVRLRRGGGRRRSRPHGVS
jgi:hypothetical protein